MFTEMSTMPQGAGHNILFLITAFLVAVSSAGFAYHIGVFWRVVQMGRRLMLLTVPLVQSTMALAFCVRWRQGIPFQWQHWVTLVAICLQIAAEFYMWYTQHRERLHGKTLGSVEAQDAALRNFNFPE